VINDDRRAARERALGLLYEAEVKGLSPAEVLAEQIIVPEQIAADIVAGVSEHLDELDTLIRSKLSGGWDFTRLAPVDRAVLRIGAYELAHRPDVPTKVVLNEAIELAKTYSTEDSGRFVNGVLAAVASLVRNPGT
jgi:N utilization substance protein B